ncbi:SKP1-like protein 1A [Acorus calamus]|uniref:SKP1-like protein n=1 Tax=Acorus calamus TaxID=4465 RepID=A0AAV9FF30_ACOCL|nr:SKP1-like protein 1A [Acorus calamus]
MASSPQSRKNKTVILRSNEGEEFTVDEAAAAMSNLTLNMMSDGCADNPVPLHNVSDKTLKKVVQYIQKHALAAPPAAAEEDLREWDRDFIDVSTDDLYDILMAANYMEIPGLLDLVAQKTADLIKGKSAEEIRKTFKIPNDFSTEQDREIRKEANWFM